MKPYPLLLATFLAAMLTACNPKRPAQLGDESDHRIVA